MGTFQHCKRLSLLALMVAMAFPRAFASHGLLAWSIGLHTTIWVHRFGHSALILALFEYALLEGGDTTKQDERDFKSP
jgi:hypothetical protein